MTCIPKQSKSRAISENDLLYMFKLSVELDITLSLSRNRLRLTNSQNEILSEYKIDFNFYSGYTGGFFSRYCNGYQAIFDSHLYVPVLFNGVIYIQYFEYLCCIQGNKLTKLCEIPEMHLDDFRSFFGRIFTLNNCLYVHGSRGGLYQYINNQLQRVKTIHKCQFYQFQDNIFVQKYNESIYKLENDLTLSHFIDGQIINSENGTLKVITRSGTVIIDMKTGAELSQNDLIINRGEIKRIQNQIINENLKYGEFNQIMNLLTFKVTFEEQKKQQLKRISNINTQICQIEADINNKQVQIRNKVYEYQNGLANAINALNTFVKGECSQ
ncbi:Conserved_hypothetical protein [Hexamita inflata]|uniref:Uncharacterized protein n=1 Tax=Hexamita inflata TaxID=28002 RepID=A0ABP1I8S0_9EUKA